jgi:C1A family cysteine protease
MVLSNSKKEYTMEEPFKTGRLQIEDKRDKNFTFSKFKPFSSTPEAQRLSKHWSVGPVLDQGEFPHCVAFAWKQFLQSSPFCQGKNMNESFIYELAQKRDQWPGENYDGTSVRAGAKVLQSLGFIKNYLWAKNTDDMKKWILTSGPIVVGTAWYMDMFFPNKDGYVTPTGALAGGHAYICVGYSASRNAFRFINSWGTDWGQKGRFWIKEEHMTKLLSKWGEACSAVEIPLD